MRSTAAPYPARDQTPGPSPCISTATMFQRSPVGPGSFIVTFVLAGPVMSPVYCVQKVLLAASRLCESITWFVPSVRDDAALQSLPTPNTSAPSSVVLNETCAGPLG